jgi:hypothetical protein
VSVEGAERSTGRHWLRAIFVSVSGLLNVAWGLGSGDGRDDACEESADRLPYVLDSTTGGCA